MLVLFSSNCIFCLLVSFAIFSWWLNMIQRRKGAAINGPLVNWQWGVGAWKHVIVQWLGLSVLVILCLWTVNFTRVSQYFFSHARLGQDPRSGLQFSVSLHQVSWGLISQQVMLWWTSFPWKQAFLRRTECTGIFKKFFPSPCQK